MQFQLPKRRKPTKPFGIKPMVSDGEPIDEAQPAAISLSHCRRDGYSDPSGRIVIDQVVQNMRLLGYSTREIAEVLGIADVTLDQWRKEFPSLQDAWIEGGQLADSKVARAMYKRAVGYQYPEQKGIKVVPPDPAAGQYWLNNRQPQLWKTAAQITGPTSTDFPAPSIHVTVIDSPPRTPLIEGKVVNGQPYMNGHANGRDGD